MKINFNGAIFPVENKLGLGLWFEIVLAWWLFHVPSCCLKSILLARLKPSLLQRPIFLPRRSMFREPFWRVIRRCLWRPWLCLWRPWLVMISLGPRMDIRLKMLSLILDFFSQLYYSHVKRKGNKVIYCLAKYFYYCFRFGYVDKGCSTAICFCTSGWFSQLF